MLTNGPTDKQTPANSVFSAYGENALIKSVFKDACHFEQ